MYATLGSQKEEYVGTPSHSTYYHRVTSVVQ